MVDIYYIGGAPCSGKSTVAEFISNKYDLYYFKVDDFLDEYIEKGAFFRKPICIKQKNMTPEQTWMRDPKEQSIEEMQFYEEIFGLIMKDIMKIYAQNGIIAEGAAFLPRLVKRCGIEQRHYVSITPTAEFQVAHYKERLWVPYVLEGCSNKEKAFNNWMNRDIMFANDVTRQCLEEGYDSFVNDGSISIDELIKKVCLHFNMEV